MIEIKLETYSWIAESLGLPGQGTGILNKSIEKGSTLQTLFTKLAVEYPKFADKVYNPASGHLNNRLIAIADKKIVRDVDLANIVLKEGDLILITPIITGG